MLLFAGFGVHSSAFEDVDHEWKHTARDVWEVVWEGCLKHGRERRLHVR